MNFRLILLSLVLFFRWVLAWVHALSVQQNLRSQRKSHRLRSVPKHRSIGMAGLSFGLSLLLSASPAWGKLPEKIQTQDQPGQGSLSGHRAVPQDRAGRQFFANGDFAAAVAQWQAAVQGYGREGNRVAQVQTLSNLALAHQRLGQREQAEQAIAQSLQLLNTDNKNLNNKNLNNKNLNTADPSLRARVLTAQGSLEFDSDPAVAFKTWTQAEAAYQMAKDKPGMLRSQLNQAQALQQLGFYQRSLRQLTGIVDQLQTQDSDPSLTITAVQRLASLHRLAGSLNESEARLQQSLDLATASGSGSDILSTLFMEQGETDLAQGQFEAAIAHFEQAESLLSGPQSAPTDQPASPSPLSFQIQHAKLRTYIAQQNNTAAAQQWSLALAQHDAHGPVGEDLDFAATLLRLNDVEGQGKSALTQQKTQRWSVAEPLLKTALDKAQKQSNIRAEAIALGLLGELHEQQSQWSLAQRYAEAALKRSEQLDAPELTYRWQWLLGRLEKQQGHKTQAVAAYSNAVQHLGQFEDELVRLNPGVQFSLHRDIDPVYRQLIDLLLSSEAKGADAVNQAHGVAQNVLGQAQETIDQMRRIELGNFLGQPCSVGGDSAAMIARAHELDPTAAIVTPVMLEDRIEVLLQLPNGHLDHYASPIPQAELEQLLRDFRYALVVRSRRKYLPAAQRLYDLILRPLESVLAEQGIETLVFSLDSALNSVPMAVLHNGEHYLVEDYKIAITPGLDLMAPQPIQGKAMQTLAVGLTEARNGFTPLRYVTQEMAAIAKHAPQSKVLLDQDFTQKELRDRISNEQFPVVHIATHGQFSSDPSDTFLLAWDDPIQVRALDQMLQARGYSADRAIELLVLSACQTAVGDERAALGMAGVAIKAGARSTLATLWAVDDQATSELMDAFYESLSQTGGSRADALRNAQIALIQNPKYSHPLYWSPYILLGNWL